MKLKVQDYDDDKFTITQMSWMISNWKNFKNDLYIYER